MKNTRRKFRLMRRYNLVLLLVILLSSFAFSIDKDDAGLIGLWNLSEASGNFLDSNQNGLAANTLTATGDGITYRKSGLWSGSEFAVNFAGSDDYGVGDATLLAHANSMSPTGNGFAWGGWINHTGAQSYTVISSAHSIATWNGFWGLGDPTGGGNILCRVSGGGSHTSASISGTPESESRYFHMLCISNSSGVTLYINGTQKATTAGTTYGVSGGQVSIGANFQTASWAYDTIGQLDDVFLINRTLGFAEITDIVENGWGDPPPPPDNDEPDYANFTNNGTSVFRNGDINFSVTLSDETALDFWVFAHNQSGVMVNGTAQSISGTLTKVNEVMTVTLPRNNFICGQITFNDTSGNVNQTNLSCFTVATQKSKIDILFRNKTSAVYKSLFDEGEDFFVYLNYTLANNTLITPDNANCNITIINGLHEVSASNDDFTLCNTGCDFSVFNNTFTMETTLNAKRDIGHAFVCNEQLQQDDAVVNISCGGLTYGEVRDGATIPLCADGFAFVTINTSICVGSLDVNISISYEGAIQRRKRIVELSMDREYSEHILENGTDVIYNYSLNLWASEHLHEFYEHGIKNISGNCTNTEPLLSNSTWESITIVNQPPTIIINEVNNSAGIFELSDLVEIDNFTGTWFWSITVFDDDLTTVNYTFYNRSGNIEQSNQSSTPLMIETPSGFFNPHKSLYNLTVWADDTEGNVTQLSILINITEQDITAPVITMVNPTASNDTFIIDVWINFTTNERTNCSINNSGWDRFSDNSTFFAFNETQNPDGLYNILISCNDSAFIVNTGTFIVNFTRDTTVPVIESIIPLEDNSSNIINDGIIFLNFTLTDNIRLFVYNLTIRQKTTNEIKFNISGHLSGTSFSSRPEVNTSTWVNETEYVETLRVCDGHTSLEIKDATGIIKSKDMLTYQFDDTLIKIQSINGYEDKTETLKNTDRYNFKFYYTQPTTSKLFRLTSNKIIYYLPDSEYKAHFITGENWIDFDLQDNEVVVEKGDCDNKTETFCEYFIYIDNRDDFIEMNSIGFLNCVTEVYQFNLIATPTGILYKIGLLAGNFFNNNALNTSTTAGVLLFFFLFLCLVGLVLFSEAMRIPAVMLFTAIYGFFFGILIYVSISAILGIVFIVMGFAYMLRSISID